MSDYIFIANDHNLRRAASEWRNENELAIDIECENNLHHYGTSISIIQVSSRKKNYIVDILAITDAKPLISVLENKRILKVFHDVSFDFRILHEEMLCNPKNVFDTCIAAQFLGFKHIGLGHLLEKYFDVKKQSKFQRADWLKRPIPLKMLKYAVKDTKYSLKLKDILEKELRLLGRFGWVLEEFKALEKRDYSQDDPTFRDIKGAGKLDEKELSILKGIYEYREKLARSLDKPVYFVISNSLLIELAQKPPRGVHEWSKLRGVHPIVKQNAVKFNDIVRKASKDRIKRVNGKKRAKKLTKAQERRFDELDAIRRRIAKKLGIEGHLVLDKEEMINLATDGTIQDLKKWQQKLLLNAA